MTMALCTQDATGTAQLHSLPLPTHAIPTQTFGFLFCILKRLIQGASSRRVGALAMAKELGPCQIMGILVALQQLMPSEDPEAIHEVV